MKNKGITLISLVITIIILLILAGISIVAITGDNGLFNRAKQAKEKSDYGAAYETIMLKINEANVEKGDICTLEELEQFLSKEKETDVIVTKYNETAKKKEGIGDYQAGELKNIVVNVVKYSKYYFLIGENCAITKASKDYGKTFMDIEKFNTQEAFKDINYDWKKILESAGIDSSKYNSYEEALEDEEVIKSIASNIAGTEELTLVEGENPYYTFLAKANQSYLIQCYGAQGGSYGTTNPGGYGGYSCGIFTPKQDTTLYIYKGGQGVSSVSQGTAKGGYNGGGALAYSWSDGNEKRASGGGATHIALIPRTIIKFRK